MTNEHTSTEAPREYGELFYSADSVSTVLRVVAELLEGDKRRALLELSHSLPTTMSWADSGGHLQQETSEPAVSRVIQFGIQHDTLFGPCALRFTAMLRRGPSPECAPDWQHASGLANQS